MIIAGLGIESPENKYKSVAKRKACLQPEKTQGYKYFSFCAIVSFLDYVGAITGQLDTP